MDIVEMKRKLRDLKRLELKVRYGSTEVVQPLLVWNSFFDLRENAADKRKAKYTLTDLADLSREGYKAVINEYWSTVYNKIFNGNDVHVSVRYDMDVFKQLDLAPDAGIIDVKKRFRELAKCYHPDIGGDTNKFIALMEAYNKILNL